MSWQIRAGPMFFFPDVKSGVDRLNIMPYIWRKVLAKYHQGVRQQGRLKMLYSCRQLHVSYFLTVSRWSRITHDILFLLSFNIYCKINVSHFQLNFIWLTDSLIENLLCFSNLILVSIAPDLRSAPPLGKYCKSCLVNMVKHTVLCILSCYRCNKRGLANAVRDIGQIVPHWVQTYHLWLPKCHHYQLRQWKASNAFTQVAWYIPEEWVSPIHTDQTHCGWLADANLAIRVTAPLWRVWTDVATLRHNKVSFATHWARTHNFWLAKRDHYKVHQRKASSLLTRVACYIPEESHGFHTITPAWRYLGKFTVTCLWSSWQGWWGESCVHISWD